MTRSTNGWHTSRLASNGLVIGAGSLVALVLLGYLLFSGALDSQGGSPRAHSTAANGHTTDSEENEDASATDAAAPLVVYCAAGIKPPVEAIAKAYEQERFGAPIQLQYGGSGTLLSNLRVADRGDLFIAADTSYIDLAREQGLVREAIPLAQLTPVIAVAKGNPKQIATIDDLARDDVRLALANAEAASIGQLTKKLLEAAGQWEKISAKTKVFKPTVSEVANDVLLGAVDAAIVWDSTVRQFPDKLEAVEVDTWKRETQDVTVAVLSACRRPADALRFARYLQAPEKGELEFAKRGYATVEGDAWVETPTLVLFSGGVNRIAIQDTLREFEAREGARLNIQYNGCGILVSTMQAGTMPDAYFACDESYMTQVADRFTTPLAVSETDMIVIVQPGNPLGITGVQDLAREGRKLGIANEEQSALGGLTRRLLSQISTADGRDLYEAIQPNVKVRTPTADMLVNQLRAGGLDAAIVYTANVSQVRDKLEVVSITEGNPIAVQPIAVANQSRLKYLSARLVEALTSEPSRQTFEQAGFRWRAGAASP